MVGKKISVHNLSLPKGGGAIRGVGEKLQVQDFTGSCSFSIPVPASPCRDITPNLAVSYSSGSGNSTFGIGWNLALPKISRKTSIAIPQYDASDTFLFDDSEDLIPITGANVETDVVGTTTYNVTRYYLRNEGSFSLIQFYQNPDPTKAGDSFWWVTDRNNNSAIYGRNAKICDPTNSNHVFSWLLEELYNDKGDHQIFIYKQENSDGVSSRVVTSNLYIERICYGYDAASSEAMILNNATLNNAHFEIVFDYGEYVFTGNNPYNPPNQWLCRTDAFSVFNSGFEIRTYRRCLNILMFHRFTNELGANPILTNVLGFQYQYNYANITELVSVTETGYRYNSSTSTYETASLPPLDFDYEKFEPQKGEFLPITDEAKKDLTAISEAACYNFVDLFSEGISGILYSDNYGNYYRGANPQNDSDYNASIAVAPLYIKGNNSIAMQYENWQLLNSFPILQAQQDSEITLADVTGNGKFDVMLHDKNMHGFWQSDLSGSWKNFRSFKTFPTDYNSAQQKFVDMTGSGLGDLVQLNNKSLKIYPSLGKDGFATPIIAEISDQTFPSTLESSPTKLVDFIDIDGSGRGHLTVVTQGQVSYWPNLGYGNFGAMVAMPITPPLPDNFDTKNLFIADLDGSGTADLIYFQSNTATIYFNYSGNIFSAPITINLQIPYDDFVHVSFADINGCGNACLVMSDLKNSTAQRHWYYDFCRRKKPYLLKKISNNLGAETKIKYGSSVDFYLADKKVGLNWITCPPFPVHVVVKVVHIDAISQSRYVNQYAYHHGYYDGKEREFRGFGRVDRQDAEYFSDVKKYDSQYSTPSLVRTWYHTGFPDHDGAMSKQYNEEYFIGDAQEFAFLDNVISWGDVRKTKEDERCAYVAMAGLVLRSEIYALDNSGLMPNPYSVVQSSHCINLLQAQGTNLYSVSCGYLQQSINYDYERNPADPRIHHQFILEVDQFYNVQQSCDIYYPRRQVTGVLPQQQVLKVTLSDNSCINNGYMNIASRENYVIGVVVQSIFYEVGGVTAPLNQAFSLSGISSAIESARRTIIAFEQFYYFPNNSDSSMDVTSSVTVPVLLTQHAVVEFSYPDIQNAFAGVFADERDDPTLVLQAANYVFNGYGDGNWWNVGLTQGYLAAENFYLPCTTTDQAGNVTTYGYDSYNLHLTSVTDALKNKTSVTKIDYQTLHPVGVVDPNQLTSQVAFDPLGRVIYTTYFGFENNHAAGFDPINQIPTDLPPLPQNLPDLLNNNPTQYLGNMQSFFYYDSFAWQSRKEPAQSLMIVAQAYPNQAQQISDFASNYANQFHAYPMYGATGTTPPPSQTPYLAITYSDGFGRIQQSKISVEDGPAFSYDATSNSIITVTSTNRWLTSGAKVYNNKGDVVKEYEPYYFDSPFYVDDELLNSFGFSSTIYYDALGRAADVLTAKGFLNKNIWSAWQEQIFDENDTIIDSPYYQANVANHDSTSPYYDQAFQSNSYAQTNLKYIAQYFYNTPATKIFDNMGYVIIEQKINVSDQQAQQILPTTYTYDILGRILTATDPRGICSLAMTYAMSSQVLRIDSVDAGVVVKLNNAFGKQCFHYNSNGNSLTTNYDALNRPSEIILGYVPYPKSSGQIVEKFIYGDSQTEITNPQNYNLIGKVYQHYDQSGLVTLPSYSISGTPLIKQSCFLQNYQGVIDWTNSNQLQAVTYPQFFVRDPLGKIIVESDPGSNVMVPIYYNSGRLAELSSSNNLVPSTVLFVYGFDAPATIYNAKGQLTFIQSSSATINYNYDPKTDAVTEIQGCYGCDVFQDLQYFYDPVGNVIQKNDNAQTAIFGTQNGVSAASNYKHDAIYQLITATGREQLAAISRNTSTQPTALSLVNYVEQYTYDISGNLSQISHNVVDNSAKTWTRNITVDAYSNRAVISTIAPTSQDVAQFFDDCGNQIKTEKINQISWNYHNNISSTLVGDNSEYYIYNGSGRRVRKVSAAGEDVLYFGNFEIHISGENQYHFLRVNAAGNIVGNLSYNFDSSSNTASNMQYFLQLHDHLNSGTIQLNIQGEGIVSAEEFSPYGSTTVFASTVNTSQPKNYRYSDKEKDDTDFYYYGARYYCDNIGRWLSPDPIGPIDGLNLYAFVQNNPVTFVDVGGMMLRRVAMRAAPKPLSHQAMEPVFRKVGGAVRREVGKGTKGDLTRLNKISDVLEAMKGRQDENALVSTVEHGLYGRKAACKREYRRAEKGSDEHFTAASVADTLVGIGQNLQPLERQLLEVTIAIVSQLRFPTNQTGYRYHSGGLILQHPTARGTGFFAPSGTASHDTWERNRRALVLASATANPMNYQGVSRIIGMGIEALKATLADGIPDINDPDLRLLPHVSDADKARYAEQRKALQKMISFLRERMKEFSNNK